MNNRFASSKAFPGDQRRRRSSANQLNGGEEETIDSSLITPQLMAMLRRTDPFTYYSIVTAMMGTTYCDLDTVSQDRNQEQGDGDAGAGGVDPRSDVPVRHRVRNHSFHDAVQYRMPVSRSRQTRRCSMPNLESTSIQGEHHVAPRTEVKRRRRFATEADACTVIGRMMDSNNS
eukprot:CCRYP_012189-RA/>CCRYP_012189-RA protein AED:0.33 eAED:0.33 QI:0/-1/0/1/-1/1/1/0/173